MDMKVNALTDSVNVTMHTSSFAGTTGSYAKVQRNTAYIGNIVERVNKNALIPGGKETLLYVAGLLRDGIIELLSEGKAVDLLEMGVLYLKPKSGIGSANPEIEDVPQMTLSFTPSEKALAAVKDIVVAADVTKPNIPVIKEVFDTYTKSKDGVITIAHTVRITGKGLKVAGEKCGVYLCPCSADGDYKSDESDWILVSSPSDFIDNMNSRLEFNVPAAIAEGKYRLAVKTAYGSGTRVNKSARSGFTDGIITVQVAS